jgi:predicted GIY-YIG superfamily endonuclease
MPKVPIDYSKTCIYKLVHFDDLNDENIYVGHTTDMTKRKWEHKNACCNPNNKHYNLKVYQFIRENGGWDKWDMILVEKYPTDNVHEAIARERYWKRELNTTLNTREPGRTAKEWCEDNKEYLKEHKKEYYQNNIEYFKIKKKEYHENNREKNIQKMKDNYHNNKEKINEKKKEKITCECGCILRKDSMPDHLKTIKHQDWLKNNNLTIN